MIFSQPTVKDWTPPWEP